MSTLSGGFCNPVLESFVVLRIPVVNCPHEQISGHLADGHTRITQNPGVRFVGPEGFTSAILAMLEAWGGPSPVIFATGSSTLGRKGAGGFKEIDDVSIANPLIEYSIGATDGTRISEFVDHGEPPPGTVNLSIPVDIVLSSFH